MTDEEKIEMLNKIARVWLSEDTVMESGNYKYSVHSYILSMVTSISQIIDLLKE